jgi:hypothetical protein
MSELTAVPRSFTAGTTVKFTLSFSDYPADAGWNLAFFLAGLNVIEPVSGVANGSAFDVTLSATASGKLQAGNYQWQVLVTKSGETYLAAAGVLEVLPNIASAKAGDLQTWEERTLQVVEAVLEDRLPADQQAYQIAGRAVTKMPIAELMNLRAALKNAVRAQKAPGSFMTPVRVGFSGTASEPAQRVFPPKWPWAG